jgi:hypothetical protein
MHVAVEARFDTAGTELTPAAVNEAVTKTVGRTEAEEWNIKELGAEIYKDLSRLKGVRRHGGIITVTDVGDFTIVLDCGTLGRRPVIDAAGARADVGG